MARKSRDEDKGIKQETMQAVFAILFFVLALLSVLAAFEKAGFVGEYTFKVLKWLLGLGYFLLPVMLVMLGIAFLKGIKRKFQVSKLIGALLFFFSGLGLVELLVAREGGVLGYYIAHPLIALVDVYATAALLVACVAISVLITFEIYFTVDHLMFWKWMGNENKEKEDRDEESEEKIDKAVFEVENKLQRERYLGRHLGKQVQIQYHTN